MVLCYALKYKADIAIEPAYSVANCNSILQYHIPNQGAPSEKCLSKFHLVPRYLGWPVHNVNVIVNLCKGLRFMWIKHHQKEQTIFAMKTILK